MESLFPLQWFEFDVVTIGAGGKFHKSRGRAQCYTENLGRQGFLDRRVPLEMVAIPRGKFWMGAHPTAIEWIGSLLPQWVIEQVMEEKGGREYFLDHEIPCHEVTVAPFFMGKFPITQAQWQRVASLPQVNYPLDPNPTKSIANLRSKAPGSAMRPMEVGASSFDERWYEKHQFGEVTSLEAIEEFCARLSLKTGRHYRLPSEAEWEYAGRAGTTTLFHFGNTLTPELANYNTEPSHRPRSLGEILQEQVYGRGTEPAGSFHVANAWGLYDMHGNVWELCADPWHENYHGAPTDGRVWQLGGDDSRRVARGGDWRGYAWSCRASSRGDYCSDPIVSPDLIGFRVVVSA